MSRPKHGDHHTGLASRLRIRIRIGNEETSTCREVNCKTEESSDIGIALYARYHDFTLKFGSGIGYLVSATKILAPGFVYVNQN